MAKIIELPKKKTTLVNMLDELRDMAEKGELQNLYCAGKLEDGNVLVCAAQVADVAEKMYLHAHLQQNITMAVVEQNLEWVEE